MYSRNVVKVISKVKMSDYHAVKPKNMWQHPYIVRALSIS